MLNFILLNFCTARGFKTILVKYELSIRWYVFLKWLLIYESVYLKYFRVGTIARCFHHNKTPTGSKQNLNLRRTYIWLYWINIYSSDNHYPCHAKIKKLNNNNNSKNKNDRRPTTADKFQTHLRKANWKMQIHFP